MKRSIITSISLVSLAVAATVAMWALRAEPVRAHCQMPCGIYDDPARIAQLREDATTIAKAIAQINELADKHDAQTINQATRWIVTKEEHASHVITVVAEYFLTQRVKPVAPDADGYNEYLKTLSDHHAVMVAAMKTKQLADSSAAEALRRAIDRLAVYYTK